MDAVVVRNLEVVRGGTPVIRDLSLTVPAGRITGLLGPSGCGKSTLMRAIVGVQRVAGGEVAGLGLPGGSPALRPKVGYVTQAPSVYGDLTVRENLDHFARVLGAPRAEAGRVLAAVDLADRAGQRVGRMSGGQQTRVPLGGPPLLVLDEPTFGALAAGAATMRRRSD